ncbi:MAG: hypothetical protein M5R42_21045 [Rhodocyclaceae bacterium]|nr:hypothetical protein [Rhodocyclaceae bacterium]
MKLALGPLQYYWPRQQVLDFYEAIAAAPVDIVTSAKPSARAATSCACRTGPTSRRHSPPPASRPFSARRR